MSSPATERRRGQRRGISLPTLGLSLEELILLLEVAPRGWTETEAAGLIRRISRELSNQSQLTEDDPSDIASRWQTLSLSTDESLRKELGVPANKETLRAMGDALIAGFVGVLKESLKD